MLKSIAVLIAIFFLSSCDYFSFVSEKNPNEKPWLELIESSTSLDGQVLFKKDFEGKTVFINFWASWCAPCKEEMPGLFKIARRQADQIAVLAISQDDNLREAKKWIGLFPKSFGAGMFLISDEKRIWARKFKISKLPETFVYDAKGNFLRRFEGAINFEGPEIQKIISTKTD